MIQTQESNPTQPSFLQTRIEPSTSNGGHMGEADTGWLAGVLDALSVHIAVIDPDGSIVAVNRAWTRFADQNAGAPDGYGPGANYLAVVRASAESGDESAAAAYIGLQQVLAGKTPQFSQEYPCHSDSEQRWFLLQVSPLPDAAGAVVSHLDISERKRHETELQHTYEDLQRLHLELQQAQSQILQSEKMASVGQLAAGVAHEINNPIGYLHSNLGTLQLYVGDLLSVLTAYELAEPAICDPALAAAITGCKQETDFAFLRTDISTLLTESREGTQRVRKIVRDLQDFARSDENDDWQWVDLRHCLDRTLTIAANELKYKAEVERDFGEIPEIHCLPGQLNQVFLNLLVNAAHAIETQGRIQVRTWQEDAGNEQGDTQVCVEISDNGAGIPADVQKRIFEPFFTTKPIGKGTGLGLSISWGIVQKHGGRIDVDSTPGQGSRFRITLQVNGPVVSSC